MIKMLYCLSEFLKLMGSKVSNKRSQKKAKIDHFYKNKKNQFQAKRNHFLSQTNYFWNLNHLLEIQKKYMP